MKRIVSILSVLVLLLCSTAALAAAPTISGEAGTGFQNHVQWLYLSLDERMERSGRNLSV